MNDLVDHIDVLVVYSQKIAKSASVKNLSNSFPFDINSNRRHYNYAYAYFLEECARNNLRAGFTSSSDIIGSGLCNSYWVYKNNQWLKIQNKVFAPIIFNKFSPNDNFSLKNYHILFSNSKIIPFHTSNISNLFSDKLKTFLKLSEFCIPTVSILNNSLKNIEKALLKLNLLCKNLPVKDFKNGIILKDRYGAGGYDIHRIDQDLVKNIKKIMDKKTKTSYILQPFIFFDKSFVFNDIKKPTDIRIIFMGEKIIQAYIRIAKKNDFRCNQHQGGTLKYLNINKLPANVANKAKLLAKKINKLHSLYALDFIVGNSGKVYLLEGNSKPGLVWDINFKDDELNAKALIQTIIIELKVKINKIKNQSRILEIPQIEKTPIQNSSENYIFNN